MIYEKKQIQIRRIPYTQKSVEERQKQELEELRKHYTTKSLGKELYKGYIHPPDTKSETKPLYSKS